jgi:hypothetical protein
MLNHLSPYSEFLNENDLSYSGGDVTKMPIIGRVTTNPIGPFDEATYDVVEIIRDQKGNPVYVCNFWYKDYKRIPQLIHSALVKSYIPNENLETFED